MKKYEYLVNELANVKASTEVYKNNKEEIEMQLEKLEERIGVLLDLLDDTINKEPVYTGSLFYALLFP